MAVGQKNRKRTVGKSIERKLIGDEPVDITGKDLTVVYNWYNYMYDNDMARKFVIDYMKNNRYSKDDIAAVRASPISYFPTTVGWIARIMSNGNLIPESSSKFFSTRLNTIIENGNEVLKQTVKKADAPRISIQDRIAAKNKIVAERATIVTDSYMSMYEFLVSEEITKPAAEYLLSEYQKIADELNSNDPDVIEAFGKRLKSERQYWNEVVSDLDRYIDNKAKTKKVRKPRTKKVKAAVDQVKNVTYQKADPTLKLVSVDPINIVGASQVWVYNTARQLLTVYNAQGPAGLKIVRSSIKNFDPDTSMTKSARRNTEKVLDTIINGGKVKLRKAMAEINASQTAASGRLNANSIIVKVIK